MLKLNKNYVGDTIDVMKKIDDKEIQLVVTSPPYNASIRKDNHKYPGGNYEDSMEDSEYVKWIVNVFKEYERILKDDGVVAFNLSYTTFSPSLPYLLIAEIFKNTNFMIADTLAWKKKSAVPLSGHPNRMTRICEFVYIFVKKDSIEKFKANKIVSSTSRTGQKYFKTYFNFIETKNNDGCTDIHKATYSTDFVKYFIDLYSFEDSIVLDNFMGTGTSAIGCIDLKRNWIGIDMCENYVEYANSRIKNHVPCFESPLSPKKVNSIKNTEEFVFDSSKYKKGEKYTYTGNSTVLKTKEVIYIEEGKKTLKVKDLEGNIGNISKNKLI